MKVLAHFKTDAMAPMGITVNVDPEDEVALRKNIQRLFEVTPGFSAIYCIGAHYMRFYFYINGSLYARTYGPDELALMTFNDGDAQLLGLLHIWRRLEEMNYPAAK